MRDCKLVRRIVQILFHNLVIIVGISVITTACSSQSKTILFQSQFNNIELKYPEGWLIQDSIEGLLLQNSYENIDAEITVLFNPPEYMEGDLQESLENFASSDLLPDVKEILTTGQIQEINFNGYQAVQQQVVADVAKYEGASYAIQFDLILTQNEDNRAIIIVLRRGGTDTINKEIARDINRILSSFRFL